MTLDEQEFLRVFNEEGYVIVESVFDENFTSRARVGLLDSIEDEYSTIGIPNIREHGLLLCTASFGIKHPVFFEFFENEQFLKYFELILGEGFIVYMYSCACISPNNGKLFTSNIHVDLPRIIPNYNSAVGAILCTDDFTLENGATWLLPKSQYDIDRPDEVFFYENAKRLVAKAGSVCFFNPRLWHAAGTNTSNEWRTSLNVGMCKPWMKQRIDIPRFLKKSGIEQNDMSDKLQQLLGFHSQPPASYDEYFAAPEMKTFKQKFI